jgi:hypothetical protein
VRYGRLKLKKSDSKKNDNNLLFTIVLKVRYRVLVNSSINSPMPVKVFYSATLSINRARRQWLEEYEFRTMVE